MFKMFGNKRPDELGERFAINFNKKYGEGGYGATFEASEKASGEIIAVKIIDTKRMRPEAIAKECQILDLLEHPNIIALKGHGLGQGSQAHLYFIFMELAGGGELFDQVISAAENGKFMREHEARTFFCQMLDGVGYCHLAGVAHRDLKLENVLLNAAGVVKVIDFGLSHVYPRGADGTVDRSKPLKDVCGSKSYAAPEVLGARGYDGYAADMWSLGVCLFAMLSGFFPLDEASSNDWRYAKLVDTQMAQRSSVAAIYSWYKRSHAHLSAEVVQLLDHLLMVDPAKRATMAEVRENSWVLARKFGGASNADQGSFNVNDQLVNDEGPQYRGIHGGIHGGNYGDGPIHGPIHDAVAMDDMDDGDEPVYRSLGLSTASEVLAARSPTPGLEPSPAPSLCTAGAELAFELSCGCELCCAATLGA